MIHDGFEGGDFEQLETVEAAAMSPMPGYHPYGGVIIVVVLVD